MTLSALQSSAMGTHMFSAFVAGKTANSCGGFPTAMVNLSAEIRKYMYDKDKGQIYVDQDPSFPYQLPEVGITSAGGTPLLAIT